MAVFYMRPHFSNLGHLVYSNVHVMPLALLLNDFWLILICFFQQLFHR